jgi:cysteine desulfurase
MAENTLVAHTKSTKALQLLASIFEHPSVLAAANELRRRGYQVLISERWEPLDAIREERLEISGDATDLYPAVSTLMLANNETGIIEPVRKIAQSWHAKRVSVHTDAVQAVGKIPVNFRDLGVDAMTLAPHKFHGPLGIGALALRHGVKLDPQLFGGFQQEALRPGTENVALAVGFHEALQLAVAELPERAARMQSLRDELERSILAEEPGAVIIGREAPRLPNTSCLSFPGLDRQALVMALDLAGVACSTGSACASGSSEPSPTLVAMGLPKAVVEGAIRLSLGAFTTAPEVVEATRRIINTVKHLRLKNSG